MAKTDAFLIPMLAGASSLNATSDPVPLNNAIQHWHGADFGAGCSAGKVAVEWASTRDFAGTWDILTEFDFADNGNHSISLPGPGGFVRHRVSDAIVGGTASSKCRRMYATSL